MNKKYCKNCGEMLSDNSRFCEDCGTQVGATQQSTDAPQYASAQPSAGNAGHFQAIEPAIPIDSVLPGEKILFQTGSAAMRSLGNTDEIGVLTLTTHRIVWKTNTGKFKKFFSLDMDFKYGKDNPIYLSEIASITRSNNQYFEDDMEGSPCFRIAMKNRDVFEFLFIGLDELDEVMGIGGVESDVNLRNQAVNILEKITNLTCSWQ